ncbi:importin subunit beta-1-like [Micractinium conductrix]|uniref:Importin subunit beta-1-like n=1 Tax=Micractinium conductrix TaxID=554055 RepID=A0A2P6VN39_9CHLO|nr:importin subunit beta-1-like [Micractinium conductrix]|eukprot:PSC75516.1 importin subunit beta-1-like [Micractinium conductrix]
MLLTPLLQAAQSPDAGVRTQAEQQLTQLQQTQPAELLVALSCELCNGAKPLDARRLAGLILKNTLDAKEESRKAALVAQWVSADAGMKKQVKANLLATLGTQGDAGHTAALVIAKVAAIELPRKEWPELIAALLSNISAQPSTKELRQSTLETLGYTCEELGNLEEDYLSQLEVNSILTAVVQGMRKEEPELDVRHAATVALQNALTFAHNNFGNDGERNYIMQITCEGTLSESARIRQASWECLACIASGYYDKLPAYMTEIFTLTQRTVQGDEEEVVLQALEFWCTVAEEELDRDGDASAEPDSVNHNFIKAALPHLVSLLLEQLTKQEEGQETDDGVWNVSMASGTCLALCASVAEDAIVPLVMPYVTANIQKADGTDSWRAREAATFAFGSILEGPSVETLGQLVQSGLGFLLTALKQDPNAHVKDTTAWTIGRIFEFVHGEDSAAPLLGPGNLPQVVEALLLAIRDAPHIAEKVCYAISQLASGFYEQRGTSAMSPYFKDVVQALLETASRPADAAEQTRLQTQAFEAINEVVRASAADTTPMIVQLIPLVVGKLGETLHMGSGGGEAAERQSEIQGLLCGMTQVIVQKLSDSEGAKAGVLQYADNIMEALMAVFACRKSSVHEEAMLAVGAMTYACGRQFSKYMERFYPVLQTGLAHHQEWQVCQVTVGVLGDICRAIEDGIYPYCNAIMQTLLTNLQSSEVHRNIKPQILSAFGDIALAIGDRYEKYLQHVISMLQSAMQLSVQQQQQEDAADYNNLLRHGILEAWAGMFNGMSKEKAEAYLKPYAPALLDFVEAIYADKAGEDSGVWKASAALLGDVASTLSAVGVLFQHKAYVQPFLQQLAQDSPTADTANWASQMIQKALRS